MRCALTVNLGLISRCGTGMSTAHGRALAHGMSSVGRTTRTTPLTSRGAPLSTPARGVDSVPASAASGVPSATGGLSRASTAQWQLSTPRTVGDLARGFMASDLAGGVRGRLALHEWQQSALASRRSRVAELQVRFRRCRRELRQAFDALTSAREEEMLKQLARHWCTRHAPLRKWKRFLRAQQFARATSDAALTHRMHLAWHHWRQKALMYASRAQLGTAAVLAARSHNFMLSWHTWRQRTLESRKRGEAEMAAATEFVMFIRRVLSTCAHQVLQHWRAIAAEGVSFGMMLNLAASHAWKLAASDALLAMLTFCRERRLRVTLKIEAKMALRQSRIAHVWCVWARRSRARVAARTCGLLVTQHGQTSRLVALRRGLRKWRLCAGTIGGAAARMVLVSSSHTRKELRGGFRHWYGECIARFGSIHVCENASRYASSAALLRALRWWRGLVAYAEAMSAAVRMARISRSRLGLVRLYTQVARQMQRTEWLEAGCHAAAVAVALLRARSAWRRWPRSRVPAALQDDVADLHFSRMVKQTCFWQWAARAADASRVHDAIDFGFRSTRERQLMECVSTWRHLASVYAPPPLLFLEDGRGRTISVTTLRARLSALRAFWKRWPRYVYIGRWQYSAAIETSDEHWRRLALRECWRRWPRTGLSPIESMTLALYLDWKLKLIDGWRRWRLEIRRCFSLHFLSPGGRADATAVAAIRRRWVAWHSWQRRVAEYQSVALLIGFSATMSVQSALRTCWRRWPRQRIPPRLSDAVASAHDRVMKLQLTFLAWQAFGQAAEVRAAQRAVCTAHQLASTWTVWMLAVVSQQANASLDATALAFARRSAIARGIDAWLRRCLGYEPAPRVRHATDDWLYEATNDWLTDVVGEEMVEEEASATATCTPRVASESSARVSEVPSEEAEYDAAEAGFRAGFEAGAQAWASVATGNDAEAVAGAAAAAEAAASLAESELTQRHKPLSPGPGETSAGGEVGLAIGPHSVVGDWGDLQSEASYASAPPPLFLVGPPPTAPTTAPYTTAPMTVDPPTDATYPFAPTPSSFATPRTYAAEHTHLSLRPTGMALSVENWAGGRAAAHLPLADASTLSGNTSRLAALLRRPDAPIAALVPAFLRWCKRSACQLKLAVLTASVSDGRTMATLLAVMTQLWRHAAERREHSEMTAVANGAYAAQRLSEALVQLEAAAQETWWRVRREKATSHTRKTDRRAARRMLHVWALYAMPLALGQRVQDHGHRRETLRSTLASWRDRCASLRTLYYGYVNIASRIGYRVAFSTFERWRCLAVIHAKLLAAILMYEYKTRGLALQAWRVHSSVRSLSTRQWHRRLMATFMQPRRDAKLRAALEAWHHRSVVGATWHGLMHGSDARIAHERIVLGMQMWREFAARTRRLAMNHELASIAGPGTANRRLKERVASSFARWHEVCVLAIPPVMRQLLKAKKRMEMAQHSRDLEVSSYQPLPRLAAALAEAQSGGAAAAEVIVATMSPPRQQQLASSLGMDEPTDPSIGDRIASFLTSPFK